MDDPGAADLSFDERPAIIVDREIVVRGNRRLARLVREARLRFDACIEDSTASVPEVWIAQSWPGYARIAG